MADVNDIANRIWDNYLNSLTDIAYGASRALNGLSFGGLDYLGDKFGIDTRMRGYLNTLSPEEQLLRERLGDFNEFAGAGLGLGKVLKGVGLANTRLQRWNGARNLIKQLNRGTDFKDINFGKMDADTLNRVNDLRESANLPRLTGNLYIPANVVRKFYNKRLNEGYTPEGVANLGKRLFHEPGNEVGPSRYSHIQQVMRPREAVDEYGYISQNPANGQTVIKTMLKTKK